MEFENWWLVALPLFFGLGWLAARIDIKHVVTESRSLPRSYFKGLNFLLNEQPDKAIEAFTEVVRIDPETIELHFALGSLFRRRGETDRAIRLHKALLERPDLKPEQRLTALSALGQDYLKAGLLDRAEEAFTKLTDSPHRAAALASLLEIYQLEKDWKRAIETARSLAAETGQSYAKEIANYYCEIANAELAKPDLPATRQALEEALAANRRCVRASMLLGDCALREGDTAGAIESWRRIGEQNPTYIALVAQRLVAAYRTLGQAEDGLALLQQYLASHPSLDLLDVTFQSALELKGPDEAHRLVRDELRRNPTLLGLDRLLEAQLLTTPPERRPEIEMVKNLVHGQTRRLARYRCENCGFKARQFYWQCPACASWETYPPKRTEEFDLTP